MKEFNITGICIPEENYMVDIRNKQEQIIKLIDKKKYFTINRARQYGKTTMFSQLAVTLKNRYLVILMSFEGTGNDSFQSEEAFVRMFVNKVADRLEMQHVSDNLIQTWLEVKNKDKSDRGAFERLKKGIQILCESAKQPIVLMIDEIDQNSDNQIFLNFLGMLRGKYLDARSGMDTTFHSVILAGVYDIKNLKLKIRPDEERKYNSPWNIAVDFDVDMSFSAEEISTMLEDYENDAHTGMDIKTISEKLRFYTGGYPFLVSWLCKWMDEKGNGDFTSENVDPAVREILKNKNTLFDDMLKKLYDNPEFANMLRSMLLNGQEYSYVATNPLIELGSIFGILSSKDEKVIVSNIIFETCLYNHFLMEQTLKKNDFTFEKNQFLCDDGSLNMPQVLKKFQMLMHTEYREKDENFYERQGGLLFLCFLKPIINGTGNYYVEPRTRNNRRMDIVVFYGKKEYIIELKIWHGEKYREKGLKQLSDYMQSRNTKDGYLVSFNFNKNKTPPEPVKTIDEILNDSDSHIYEIMI